MYFCSLKLATLSSAATLVRCPLGHSGTGAGRQVSSQAQGTEGRHGRQSLGRERPVGWSWAGYHGTFPDVTETHPIHLECPPVSQLSICGDLNSNCTGLLVDPEGLISRRAVQETAVCPAASRLTHLHPAGRVSRSLVVSWPLRWVGSAWGDLPTAGRMSSQFISWSSLASKNALWGSVFCHCLSLWTRGPTVLASCCVPPSWLLDHLEGLHASHLLVPCDSWGVGTVLRGGWPSCPPPSLLRAANPKPSILAFGQDAFLF